VEEVDRHLYSKDRLAVQLEMGTASLRAEWMHRFTSYLKDLGTDCRDR
jgi:hypothetical protein